MTTQKQQKPASNPKSKDAPQRTQFTAHPTQSTAPNRRQTSTDDRDGLMERTIKIRRVTKVVQGGRNLKFSVLVAVGDGQGNVGVALGSSANLVDAIRKAGERARKSMVKIALRGTTVPHQVVGKFSASKVLLKPAGPGTGIIAGGGVRSVIEVAGITDILTKRFGSNNPINTAKATLEGLKMMFSPEEELSRRYGRKFTYVPAARKDAAPSDAPATPEPAEQPKPAEASAPPAEKQEVTVAEPAKAEVAESEPAPEESSTDPVAAAEPPAAASNEESDDSPTAEEAES